MLVLLTLMLQPPILCFRVLSNTVQSCLTHQQATHASTCNLLVQTWRLPLLWMRCLNLDTVQSRNSCSALQHLSSFRPLP